MLRRNHTQTISRVLWTMRKKIFIFLSLSAFIVAAIFAAFPVEYSRIFGLYEESAAINKLVLALTDFHLRNDIRYPCGSETYFGFGNAMTRIVPGLPTEQGDSLLSQGKVSYLFVSDFSWGDEYEEFIEKIKQYNLFLASKCVAHN